MLRATICYVWVCFSELALARKVFSLLFSSTCVFVEFQLSLLKHRMYYMKYFCVFYFSDFKRYVHFRVKSKVFLGGNAYIVTLSRQKKPDMLYIYCWNRNVKQILDFKLSFSIIVIGKFKNQKKVWI